jgi:tRNA pseudouridine55 synthase
MTIKHNPVSGLLNINKPKGLTSHDVVNRVRKLSGQRQVGHTGTLDPMATGVLLVCLGQATRLIEYLTGGHKRYLATIRFGVTTDTLDAEGKVVAQAEVSSLTGEQLRKILPTFLGEIEQIPPVFSALKKNGQPLYRLARAGQEVEVKPRQVTIYALTWRDWRPPDLALEIDCSPGTYIRALARDIGQATGSGATLIELTRLANGHWTLDQAISLELLEDAAQTDPSGWQKYLHPIEQMLPDLSKVVLDEVAVRRVAHGGQIEIMPAELEPTGVQVKDHNLVCAYTAQGDFLAILKRVRTNENVWQPKKVFQIR